jgi:hypothetical protein
MKKKETGFKIQEPRVKVTIVVLSCFLLLASFLLLPPFRLINTYDVKAESITVDNFGNFYTLSKNKILKFGPDGKYLYPYEEFRYGKVGMLDVTNPMKMLVFYPDFQTIVWLDKFLSPLSSYSFFNMGYQNITAIGSSIDGRIWFYDNVEFKLKKIDEAGNVFRESQPLNVVMEEAPDPNFIIERDNQVYVNDANLGILVFDYFGSYSKTIPLKGLTRFQVVQKQIVYRDGNKLQSYNPVTFELKEVTLPDTTALLDAVLEKESLGILRTDKVEFYKY